VVTARGQILTASANQNSDLFWGIRGAGCNLGVVTEFVLQLHPQRRTVFAGIIAFPPPLIPRAVSATTKLWETGLSEKQTLFYAQTTDPSGNVRVSQLRYWASRSLTLNL
jgi:FAD/FMN-containing dehydrogenase